MPDLLETVEFQPCDYCRVKMKADKEWSFCKGCNVNREAISKLKELAISMSQDLKKLWDETKLSEDEVSIVRTMREAKAANDLSEGWASSLHGRESSANFTEGRSGSPLVERAKQDVKEWKEMTRKQIPVIHGDERFKDVVDELLFLHYKKSADYGHGVDVFANLRASAGFGIPPWVGAVVRLNDKIIRIQSFVKNGRLENESLEDSLKDISAYAVLALILYRETLTSPEAQ